jgi:hypothetical protein
MTTGAVSIPGITQQKPYALALLLTERTMRMDVPQDSAD